MLHTVAYLYLLAKTSSVWTILGVASLYMVLYVFFSFVVHLVREIFPITFHKILKKYSGEFHFNLFLVFHHLSGVFGVKLSY